MNQSSATSYDFEKRKKNGVPFLFPFSGSRGPSPVVEFPRFNKPHMLSSFVHLFSFWFLFLGLFLFLPISTAGQAANVPNKPHPCRLHPPVGENRVTIVVSLFVLFLSAFYPPSFATFALGTQRPASSVLRRAEMRRITSFGAGHRSRPQNETPAWRLTFLCSPTSQSTGY